MTIEEIKELLQLFNASGVGELEIERDDFRIRISRASSSQEHVVSVSPAAAAPLAAGTNKLVRRRLMPAPIASSRCGACAPTGGGRQ